MKDFSYITSSSPAFIENMYRKFVKDPNNVDPEMKKFDLGADRQDVVPVMKEILKVFPSLKIMGSPWSPPTWMKTNNDTRGGQLKPEFYDAYAKYFVRYIQQMKEEGIVIDAITVQNEPLHPGNNPSLLMTAPDQAVFVRDHLGPAFEKNKIKNKDCCVRSQCRSPRLSNTDL